MWSLIRKDLLIELRTKETLASLLVLGVLTLLVMSFAFDPAGGVKKLAAPGVLWITVIFAGVLAINRSFLSERENDCLQGLLLCPVDRGSIYLAKAAGNAVFMLAAQAFVLPVFVVFFDLTPSFALLRLAVVVVLGVIGFAAAGTLFAAISVRTRAREVMLPLLLLPLVVPVIIGGVSASSGLLEGRPFADVRLWLNLLVSYDVIVVVVGWLLFEYAVEE